MYFRRRIFCLLTNAANIVVDADFIVLGAIPAGPGRGIAAFGVATLGSGSMHVAAIGRRTWPKADISRPCAIASGMGRARPEPAARVRLREHAGIERRIIAGVIHNAL